MPCNRSYQTQAEALFVKRLDPDAARESAKLYALAACDPDASRAQREAYSLQAARLYSFLSQTHWNAYLHREDDQEEARAHRLEFSELGMRNALVALKAIRPERAERLRAEGLITAVSMGPLGLSEAQALHWYVANFGQWVLEQGPFSIKAHQVEIHYALEALDAQHPHVGWAAGSRGLGVYHTVAPLETFVARKSGIAFERSMRLEPNYLMTRILYVTHFAITRQNDELFGRELEYVLEMPENLDVSIIPENTMAKRLARALLKLRPELVYD